MKLLRIHDRDTVAVALAGLCAGERVMGPSGPILVREDIPCGHKVALAAMQPGEEVLKYGYPIGRLTEAVAQGSWVHTHNLATGLGEILSYRYRPAPPAPAPEACCGTFRGYRRPGGRTGTRNEVWIIPTVGCVNRIAELIAAAASAAPEAAGVDGIYAFTHPFGCSQLGEDHADTQRILANLVGHPNAGGVLVIGLGCENNHVEAFRAVLGPVDPERVRFLVAQDEPDEIAGGVELVRELALQAARCRREECPASDLVVGLKCGGSDAFSGITANPLTGAFSDRLTACGGTSVLTEVPEMFGAETTLMDRAADRGVFDRTVALINDFKQYYIDHNQPVYDNPSPGNKKGGITTLEEKSLGCTQKGGMSPVVDVLPYAGRVSVKGLNLLSGPGNDMVAVTALAAAGCTLLLFTTGRGTPLGTVAPTVKIASNSELFNRKRNWLDFDAGRLLQGVPLAELSKEMMVFVLQIASGRQTKAEAMGFREIAFFKNGVML